MMMPINAADTLVLILFLVSCIFLYIGLELNHTGFIIIAIIEFILGLVQLIQNRNQIIFEST